MSLTEPIFSIYCLAAVYRGRQQKCC